MKLSLFNSFISIIYSSYQTQREGQDDSIRQMKMLLRRIEMEKWMVMEVLKKCAKSPNSKFYTINQMTYIQQFLSQHIISYYLSALRGATDHRLFTNYHNHPNFFSLTWQILLFGETVAKSGSRKWLIELIRNHLLITYDHLRDVALPSKQGDSQTIAFIKKSFQYVYVQMHQIMIRIILAHLILADYDALTPEMDQLTQEISYIYPALKAEISFSSADINLAEWFQHYLTQLIKEKTPKNCFFRFLEKIKSDCHFIGPMERLFQKLVTCQDVDDEKTREKQYQSSQYDESRSQCMSKFSQERLFNDFQLFRKKRKFICKDRLKTGNNHNTPFTTPLKKEECMPSLPQTEKTELWGNFQQNNQQSHSHSQSQSQGQSLGSSAFSRLLKKYKKPMVRTIYQGSTKTFVPKKTIGINGYTADQYIENLTASSSLITHQSLQPFDMGRKISSKLTKNSIQIQEQSQFCIPETPKQETVRKISVQKGLGAIETKRTMSRLKI